MDDGKPLIPQPEQLRSASVRENRPTLAGKRRGEHPSLATDCTVSNRKCSTEERLKKARHNPVIDGAIEKTKFPQLGPRHDAVLFSGQTRYRVPNVSGALFPLHERTRRTGTMFVPLEGC